VPGAVESWGDFGSRLHREVRSFKNVAKKRRSSQRLAASLVFALKALTPSPRGPKVFLRVSERALWDFGIEGSDTISMPASPPGQATTAMHDYVVEQELRGAAERDCPLNDRRGNQASHSIREGTGPCVAPCASRALHNDFCLEGIRTNQGHPSRSPGEI